jgi:hypothetical protein
MSQKKDQHVVPHPEGWAVKTAGASRAGSVHRTQAEAIDVARERAKGNGSEMFIHGKSGQIRERNTYGKDPYPPKG